MNANQAKHFLLSISEGKFIDWYNHSVIDQFGEFWYSEIRHNNSAALFDTAKALFDLEGFINLCKNAEYSVEDKYAMITYDAIISFNSIEDFLNMEYYGEGVIDSFLEDEEENMNELLGIEKI